MTLSEFSTVFAVLAVALRATDADEATIRVYFQALHDLDLELVTMAAERLAASGEWFPKTSEWRAAVAKIEAERVDYQRALLRRLPRPLCQDCDDTGWEIRPDGAKACGCRDLRRLEVLGRRPWPVALDAPREPLALPPLPPLIVKDMRGEPANVTVRT